MANTGIVNETPGPSGGSSRGGGSGSYFKKHKMVILGGGGLAAFLLLGHKGSSSTGTSSSLAAAQTQLQQQSDMLAAEQAAINAGNNIPTNGGSGGSTGSGSGSGSGSGYTPYPETPVPPGTVPPGLPPAVSAPTPTAPTAPNTPTQPTTPVAPTHTHPTQNGPTHSAGILGGSNSGKHAVLGEPGVKAYAPKNYSPSVQNPQHHGSGVTVHGRTFPGATHHTIHPPTRMAGGGISQRVTVSHGGHTSHHTSINQGQKWIDHRTMGGGISASAGRSAPPAAHPVHRQPAKRTRRG